MLDKTPEHRSFKFRSGFVVNRHPLPPWVMLQTSM
jgi:hypothetical protein